MASCLRTQLFGASQRQLSVPVCQRPASLRLARYRCPERSVHHQVVTASVTVQEVVAEPEPQQLVVQDDLLQLLDVLPADLGSCLINHPLRGQLIEVVLDLGRRPEARFQGAAAEFLRDEPVTRAELAFASDSVAPFGSDNRAGIQGTLHRISALRSRRGDVVGLTCRVGRAVTGHVDVMQDILAANLPVLFLGRPGVGKTTVIREIARTLSDKMKKRVVIVDTSNEIGGDGDVPHPAIGGARRMQVPDATRQHQVMIEAVENHMPEVVIVDEIGTEAEALACRTIAERGVVLIGTAHGCFLENLIKNPTLSDLVGGVASVTLGDEEARSRGCKKSVLERKAPPTFPIVIEMRDRNAWVAHDAADSVDALLLNKVPKVQLRMRDLVNEVNCLEVAYDQVEAQIIAQLAAQSSTSSQDSSAGADTSAAEANAASIDEVLTSLLGKQSNPSGSGSSSPVEGSLGDCFESEVGAQAWLGRFKNLSEAEALQELQVLKYLGGQTGVLRPRGSGGLGVAGRETAAVAVATVGSSRKKRRATKANAKK